MKVIKILSSILVILFLILCIMYINFKNKKFNKPIFDKNAVIIDTKKYESEAFKANEGYTFFVTHNPYIKNNEMYIDFVSMCDENINIKLRVYKGNALVGETGLIKKNEKIDKIKVNSTKEKGDYQFLIMSYQKGTYLSLGEIRLNVKVKE